MLRRLSRVAPALLAVACASGRAGPAPEDPLTRGLVALDASEWSEAQVALNRVARQCESGTTGTDALLLLSTAHLHPANPGRNVALAARYAAHVIRLPDVDAVRLELAESLYLTALDAGAPEPPQTPRTAPGAAPRFSACDEEATVASLQPRALPRHPGIPVAQQLAASRSRADSLAAVVDSVGAATDRVVIVRGEQQREGGGAEVDRLRSRVQALEAELDRIRRLLRKGGG